LQTNDPLALAMTETNKTDSSNQDVTRQRLIWLIIAFCLIMASLMAVFVISKPGVIEGIEIYEQQARGHNDALHIEASDLPPVGGAHHSQWQECGVYTEPVDSARAVHTLEHGAVWITYNPALSADQVADLEALVGNQDFLLLSPFPGQRSPIVLTAWAVQLEVDASDDERIPAFIARYRLGPTTPERGASC
jgi:Protein of unknown function (DUF3105)